MTSPDMDEIIVAVCTYNRNQELGHLLKKLVDYGKSNWTDCRIGATIIDDSVDGNAKVVADRYKESFPLGLVYENSASRNISIARNLALTESMHRADWVAMTDDDCEPSERWLPELVRILKSTRADVVTGLMLRRAPQHAPTWIKQQPFLELGEFVAVDGVEMPIANTNNCLISSTFLISNPMQRFDPNFGRLGGEDMAFFRALKNAGAKIVFAAEAFVYENEPDERLTLRYQIRRYFWHGNSSIVTSLHAGEGRGRLAIHGCATLMRAVRRPFFRMANGSSPQFLYSIAKFAEGLGKLAGAIGIKINHR